MKKIFHSISVLALSGLLITTTYAQSQQQTTPTPRPIQSTGTTPQAPTRVTDPVLSDRLGKDLNGRNSATQTQTINWYQTNYGYTGNYAVGSANYMARYDQQGNYVETLRQSEWNTTNVPASIRNSYGQSPYKDQSVTGYWSVTDPGKSGYYLEMRDRNGLNSTVWVDSQGKFTTAPYSSTTAQPTNIPKD